MVTYSSYLSKIALFLKYGFDVLKLHKIELQVLSFNPRGEHVYIKNGFVLEDLAGRLQV